MTDLYLIAHKVRGEAAFDVASRMNCPMCLASDQLDPPEGCHECDGLGYWWIIPTSGHRAYPWWHNEIEPCLALAQIENAMPSMPHDLPDHYPTSTPAKGPTLAERLGLTKVIGKITRRL